MVTDRFGVGWMISVPDAAAEPEFMRRGYGREMMRQALAICFADPGVHTILVDPLASNTSAHRFSARCGFRFIEERWFGADSCRVYTLTRESWVG